MVADAYEELWRDGSFDLTCLTCLGKDDKAMDVIGYLFRQTAMVHNNISEPKRKEQLRQRLDSLESDLEMLQVLNSG